MAVNVQLLVFKNMLMMNELLISRNVYNDNEFENININARIERSTKTTFVTYMIVVAHRSLYFHGNNL